MTRVAEAAASPARRLSAVLSAACLVLAFLAVAVQLSLSVFEPRMVMTGRGVPVPHELLGVVRHGALVVLTLIPAAFQMYALLRARRCFQSFRRQQYFTAEVVRGLKGFSAGIFYATIASILVTPLLSLAMTFSMSPGRVDITFRVGMAELMALLFTGIVWQIAGVMTRAIELAEENAQFV